MRTDMRCQVETDGSAAVRLTGVLDRASLTVVRDALLSRLADHAGPVVVDLAGLRIPDPTDRAVFAEVRRTVANWPGADLLVCDPAGGWTVDGVPVWPDPVVALARLPEPRMSWLTLPPTVDAARQVRELLAESCARWALPEVAESAMIVATELVNNVVAHARTPMTVRLSPDPAGLLRLGVRDHHRALPRFTGPASPTSTGGRGLLLIDRFADRWGATPLPDGKLVWAVLRSADAADQQAADGAADGGGWRGNGLR